MPLRRLPVGAEVVPGGVHFRIWAPKRDKAAIVIETEGGRAEQPLDKEGNGYFSLLAQDIKAGALYRFRLDDNQNLHPDPASRFQPQGPHGPSEVIDPAAFAWNDAGWQGFAPDEHVLYELHIGTFTAEGTWDAAARQLSRLKDIGVTTLQVMPVADFPGKFGWGYDGVNLFAPSRLYGTPDDFRAFVDAAHGHGLAVILDVVYNHLGPDGNYLREFTDAYFSTRHETEWGDALNFDGPDSADVRAYFLANVRYWMTEYHLDGLRLDATQNIYDDGDPHIIAEIVGTARAHCMHDNAFIVGENEPQHAPILRPLGEPGGMGLSAVLNDDFHHAALVALTGRAEAYMADYRGAAQEFVSLAKYGYLFQGQRYQWQKTPRGQSAIGLPYHCFVNCIENHDQLANSGRGVRVHQLASHGAYRAMTAAMILFPQTPMLFQGQEYGSSAPFNYFADHVADLAVLVAKGRKEFMAQFPSLASAEMQKALPDPAAPATFVNSKLDLTECDPKGFIYMLHKDLLALRRDDARFRQPLFLDGAVLRPDCFVIRYFGEGGDDRLLLVNFSHDLDLNPAPEPLLAPPAAKKWELIWCSERPLYGGRGVVPPEHEGGWAVTGQTAFALKAIDAGRKGKA